MKLTINDNWKFVKQAGNAAEAMQAEGERISLPHTWNAEDGQDGGNDYYRGTCWYIKELTEVEKTEEEEVYLEFLGAAMISDVYLNGEKLFHHEGGYSTFRVNLTAYLTEKNVLAVAVDNGDNTICYPQKADFTFYGGLYRSVNLLVVPREHFALDYCGTPGIKLTPEVDLETKKANVTVEVWTSGNPKEVTITAAEQTKNVEVSGNYAKTVFEIEQVHLWDGLEDPYLYSAEAVLASGDRVSTRFGCRTFEMDSQKGFLLNGRSYPLRGVSRHQDVKGVGNALSLEDHQRDMEIIKELGATTLRLAHYQHAQEFYDLCDENGLVVWAEIPYITMHMSSARANTLSQMEELIVQNYNHPSIVTWGISNEITISTKDNKDMLDNHRELNELCHKMDSTRPTTLACYAVCGPFNKVAHLSDLVSWNLYLGWYVPGLFLNDWWISFFHRVYPNRCLGYSEYGCEGMPNLHSSRPRRGDHTEEYQSLYHEFMLKCFERHPYMWSTHVWNMFDFAADARDQGGEPGMNHKGLMTFDRKVKKDSFYIYKAYWSKEPFVHLCGSRYVDRTEAVTTVKVYSNQTKVALYANGKLLEEKTGNKVFEFRVPLNGEVRLEAVSGQAKDTSTIRRVSQPNPDYKLKKSKGKSQNWV